ncbi:DUF2690 domain-containing protein [Streptomyces sp. NPDC058459]|uniref:DUF2690 domain-containing protein n=1 Tax=Streptomyces sp. NPDC058459 TaxID=3346508 RepID=UPI003646D253
MIKSMVAVGAAAVLGAFSLTVTPAAAAGDPPPSYNCGAGQNGWGCQGKDPRTTGCDRDGVLAASKAVYDHYNGRYLGTINNWYSPRCGTNWAQAVSVLPGYGWALDINNGQTAYQYPDHAIGWSATPAWTDMVFGANTWTAADLNIYFGPPASPTWRGADAAVTTA